MADLGNLIDKYVKPGWLDIVHAAEGIVEPTLTEAAKGAVATAQTAAQEAQAAAEEAASKAESASASAANSVQAVIDAAVVPAVNTAIGQLGAIPIFGSILVTEGEKIVDPLAVEAVNALIAKLESLKL